MSAPIGPGDWVECVRDDDCEGYPGMPLRRAGSLQCVSSVDDEDAECGECGDVSPGFYLQGDVPNPEWSRCACFYRLIYRPREDLIETLLQPVDGVKPSVDA